MNFAYNNYSGLVSCTSCDVLPLQFPHFFRFSKNHRACQEPIWRAVIKMIIGPLRRPKTKTFQQLSTYLDKRSKSCVHQTRCEPKVFKVLQPKPCLVHQTRCEVFKVLQVHPIEQTMAQFSRTAQYPTGESRQPLLNFEICLLLTIQPLQVHPLRLFRSHAVLPNAVVDTLLTTNRKTLGRTSSYVWPILTRQKCQTRHKNWICNRLVWEGKKLHSEIEMAQWK